ncbi:MAG: hypothetical protein QOG25_2855, partial [Acetobacteraceae bacterium]|nr:hypothetical protein [Acetobacteraceae bacterium]
MTAAVLITTAFLVWDSYQSTVQFYQHSQNRMATVLAEQAGRDFRSVDLALREIADHITASPLDAEDALGRPADRETTNILARRILAHLSQIEALTVTDAGGELLYTTQALPPSGRYEPARRYLLRSPPGTALYVGN